MSVVRCACWWFVWWVGVVWLGCDFVCGYFCDFWDYGVIARGLVVPAHNVIGHHVVARVRVRRRDHVEEILRHTLCKNEIVTLALNALISAHGSGVVCLRIILHSVV